MPKQVRVNVKTAINSSGIRRERRDGRDYIIVPSATMPDNIVMNRVRYPADEIAKAFSSLENKPAPLGHPMIEGAFVSAQEPEGLARGWIGAWNRNVRRENGRVFVDKVIDVATAQQLEGGKTVLNAIEKGEPIHTSTGLLAMLTAVENEDDVDWQASEIVFDHDAILIGEDGAAQPHQGVGMMVNAAKGADGERVDVINSFIDDDIERDEFWAIESLLRAQERKKQTPLIRRIIDAINDVFNGSPETITSGGAALNQENKDVDKAQFDALSDKVAALAEGLGGLDDKIAAVVGNALKPVIDAQEAATKAAELQAEADKLALVNKVVAAELLTEDLAKATDVAVLNALIEKHDAAPTHAYRVNSAFGGGNKAPAILEPKE